MENSTPELARFPVDARIHTTWAEDKEVKEKYELAAKSNQG